ncbi:glycine cleavage system protein H [Lentilactobacillus sp. Marseille-Q4993]|uniref:glycine cleavage system protein H n=1 Tax=Lentilactobacillus sp. Marseille-Q4993 TaxID=3039492 RepID=UPI0024BC5E2E|nr:glycine cleavage system protein H [Lentilactobacillus sp. Marseille-Q4993]
MATQSFWSKLKSLFSGSGNSTQPDYQNPEVKNGIWYAKAADGTYLLGIDSSVYDQIGKITFADFPSNYKELAEDDDLLDIEGDKSVETLKSPIAGKVIELNHELGADVDRLNHPDPKINWIAKVQA